VADGSWVEGADDSPFPLDNLPYGVTRDAVVVAIGDYALDVAAAARACQSPYVEILSGPRLDPLLAAGPVTWRDVRMQIQQWLSEPGFEAAVRPQLRARESVELLLPFDVGDYVDFYASEHHARNVGRILRPGQEPLLPNWRHLPVGYHGRSGTIVVTGSSVHRPSGQRAGPVFGPSERLDFEAEVGFVVGTGSAIGSSIAVEAFADHVFGVCLVNDWSARDIQAWEYQPLGPMLGKSFATSIAGWVTPLAALGSARLPVASAGTELFDYLREKQPWGLDLRLEVRVNGEVVSRPCYRHLHWSPAQMLAHLTVNGASVRPGDLYASGTVSGPDRSEWGSLIELTDNTAFLADGDEVVISASAPGLGGKPIALGEVRGRIAGSA
jgi:fumarylacetoacetase